MNCSSASIGMCTWRVILLALAFNTLIGDVQAQSPADKQSVAQLCLDLTEIQGFYHETMDGRKPLVILDNGIIPSSLQLTKFGEDVQFMNQTEVFFHQTEAYLIFTKFDITASQADVIFRYDVEGIEVIISLRKKDGWTVVSSRVTER